MKTTLQKLDDKKRKLDEKSSEVEKARRALVQTQIQAIFDSIGLKTTVHSGYLNHHVKDVTVSERQGIFDVDVRSDAMDFKFHVKDHTDSRLKKVKKLVEVFKSDE